MKALIQRVKQASVSIEGVQQAYINEGLLILLGVAGEDTIKDIEWLVHKIGHLRVFNDAKGIPNRSVQDIAGEIMVVSQFTLFANTKRGNRPSFTAAAAPEFANKMYQIFCLELSKMISRKVQTGVFGAHMEIQLLNDGPYTLLLDTVER